MSGLLLRLQFHCGHSSGPIKRSAAPVSAVSSSSTAASSQPAALSWANGNGNGKTRQFIENALLFLLLYHPVSSLSSFKRISQQETSLSTLVTGKSKYFLRSHSLLSNTPDVLICNRGGSSATNSRMLFTVHS